MHFIPSQVLRHFRSIVLLSMAALNSVALDPTPTSAQRKEPAKIGVLTESWGPTPAVVGLRDGLRALGYREDEHFNLGVRFTQGDLTVLPAAAQELIAAGSDVIVATSPSAAIAARRATTVKPIVFAEVVGDPVKLGLVRSFARPGTNVTGVSSLAIELTSKRLEIFKELVPTLKRVLLIYDPNDPVSDASVAVHRDAARQLGLVLVERGPRSQDEARQVAARVRRSDVDGIIASPSGMTLNIPGVVLDAASRQKIPTIFNGAFWVEQGALASYGPDFYDVGRQAARLVAKILNGESPENIPVEIHSRIEFAINLKVARDLKLQLGPAVLQRADRIIE
jgi:putative ABC transport system substrate-binding protein